MCRLRRAAGSFLRARGELVAGADESFVEIDVCRGEAEEFGEAVAVLRHVRGDLYRAPSTPESASSKSFCISRRRQLT